MINQIYQLVEGALVGRYVGVTALAAVGVSQPLFQLVHGAFLGIAAGFSLRVAKFAGAGRAQELRTAATALVLATIVCSVLGAGGMATLAESAVGVMGVEGEVAQDCVTFLRAVSIGLPSMFGTAALAALLRGLGDSRDAALLSGGATLGNIAICWLFVGMLDLGLIGAALTSAVVHSSALLCGLVLLRRRLLPLLTLSSMREPVARELRTAMGIGLPISCQYIALAVGVMVVVWIVYPLGPSFIAAMTVVGRLEIFASLIFLEMSAGLAVFTAQNLGAGRQDRVRRALGRLTALTGGLALAVSAVVLISASPIAALFTDDTAVRELTTRYIHVTYPFFILYVATVVIHGCFNGAARTSVPLACTVISFLALLPFAFLLRDVMGAIGVMWSVVFGWSVGLACTALAAPWLLWPSLQSGSKGTQKDSIASESMVNLTLSGTELPSISRRRT
jgi:putative MATE family efflux protein